MGGLCRGSALRSLIRPRLLTATSVTRTDMALIDGSGQYRSFVRGPGVKVEKHDPYAAHVALLDQYTDKEIHDVVAYLVTVQ